MESGSQPRVATEEVLFLVCQALTQLEPFAALGEQVAEKACALGLLPRRHDVAGACIALQPCCLFSCCGVVSTAFACRTDGLVLPPTGADQVEHVAPALLTPLTVQARLTLWAWLTCSSATHTSPQTPSSSCWPSCWRGGEPRRRSLPLGA